jgi:hypothetical protein
LKTEKSAADSLLGIINDLLDFSKIESDKLELDRADFSVREVLSDVLRALAVRAHPPQGAGARVGPDVPDVLFGDASRLRQVLLNPVGNAIKFTHEGRSSCESRSILSPCLVDDNATIRRILEEWLRRWQMEPTVTADGGGCHESSLTGRRPGPAVRAGTALYGTITAFSTVGGAVTSDLEDLAARGQLEETRPLLQRLEAMVGKLIEQVGGISIQSLRDQVGNAREPDRTVGP